MKLGGSLFYGPPAITDVNNSTNVQHSLTVECDHRRQNLEQTLPVKHVLTDRVAEMRNVVMETKVTKMQKCRQSADYRINTVSTCSIAKPIVSYTNANTIHRKLIYSINSFTRSSTSLLLSAYASYLK